VIRFAAILALLAGQAQALSCVPPDVRWSYMHAQESEELYFVLRGRFDFEDYTLPEYTDFQEDRSVSVPARFDGNFLTKRGFIAPRREEVTLIINCVGPWCGGAQSGTEYVAFAKETPSGLEVEVNACSWALLWPTPEQEAQLIDCVNGRSCKPDLR